MKLKEILLPGLLLLAACSGGGGTDSPALTSAALQGTVYELDGQTLDRSGVSVRVLETGQAIVTGPSGRFDFRGLPAGTITLDFGGSLAAIAHQSGESEFEDGDDHPRIGEVESDDEIEVRVCLENGQVCELSIRDDDRLRAEARLMRAAGSPDADVEGKVRIESRSDREKFQIEAEHLAPGTVVEFFLDGGSGFVSIGTMAAGNDGEAELERATNDGDLLPLGATSAGDLSGFGVEVRLAGTGELLLTGTVPDLPSAVPGMDDPLAGGRGKAHLFAHVAGLEGDVEIRRRPEDGEQRFEMEAEHLQPGDAVLFQIEDPDNAGSFVQIATATAGPDGEAEISTQDGLPMPLGVSDVADLIGLEVRVLRNDGSGTLLLSGTIPPLVAD